MNKSFIEEAFRQVYLTEDAEDFTLTGSGPVDVEGFLDMVEPEEDPDAEMISDVYDLEAEAEEDLKQSYIGKVILDCNVCHSNIFADPADITENEDGLWCVELECPYCMSNEGYTVIGEVKPYGELPEEPAEEEVIEDEVVEEPIEEVEDVIEEEPVEEEEEELIEEGLKADEIKELRGEEEINGADGPMDAVDKLEGDDDIRGPKYTELNEGCEEEKEELQECGGDAELVEGIEDVSINTEDENITMTTKEDGGVVVETSPKEEFGEEEVLAGEEMIAPIEPETEAAIDDGITANAEEAEEELGEEPLDLEGEEEIGEDELADIDFDEFDEESFSGLGESYLKRCYENVNSFKMTNISATPKNEYLIEGVIEFDSGNKKNTQFVFSTKSNENGRVKLEGYNNQISKGKKTFKLNCSTDDKKLVCESLNYNYKGKNDLNESVRVYGTVKRKK